MQVAVPGLTAALESGSTAVAGTPVLASAASEEFATRNLAKSIAAWNRPEILSLDAWLTSCWYAARYSGAAVPQLLSPAQELLLWERVVDRQAPELFHAGSAARLARRSDRLRAEWKIDLDHPAWNEVEDLRAFQSWSRQVQVECARNGWITRSGLWAAIPDWIRRGFCKPGPISFFGFERVSPGLEEIMRALPDARRLPPPPVHQPSKPILVRETKSFERGLEAAARWARQRLERHPRESNAVFVPNLAANRTLVERTFKRVFYPDAGLDPSGASRAPMPLAAYPFHVHAGPLLRDHPLIAHASLMLRVADRRTEVADAAALFRSPFVRGAIAERTERAAADLALRRRREMEVDSFQLKSAARNCPVLLEVLAAVEKLDVPGIRVADLATWSSTIADLMRAFGWPGDAELSPDDQTVLEAWKDALSELGSLSLVSAPVSYAVALGRLTSLLMRSRTELGNWSSPIQILDSSEAGSLRFNRVFLVEMSDEHWPPPALAPPLIPLSLRRSCGFPGSTPERAEEERKQLTEALTASANEVIATYTGRLSASLQGSTRIARGQWSEWSGRLALESLGSSELERIEDTYAPPFSPGEQPARGGTKIIKLQSACPFHAFSEIRLGAATPENACFGMDARERGGNLHSAMQLVWEELKDLQTLKRMSELELYNLVETAVTRAVEQGNNGALHTQAVRVERERLTRLIVNWLLDKERSRLCNFTVETVEKELTHNLAGLPLQLRIDRIDRLSNGRLLLIDYKSGAVTKNSLDCPRPKEPQILVYAAAKEADVDGMLLGQISQAGLKLAGYTREKQTKERATTALSLQWDERLSEWTNAVEGYAADFLRGYAAVDPRRDACSYCDSKPICRIREHQSGDGEEDA
jgi:ATP-dependent helicase/nuclease subunit B